jgi:hypothetical protein
MRRSTKKRLAIVGGAITTVGAAAALIAGSTFGFFSSAGEASGDNTFTAGTVIVGLDGATSVTCDIGPMSPGDTEASGTNAACKYDIVYTGNVNAYLAMDLAITGASGTPIVPYTQTTAPAAAQGLYDGSATGLQVSIADGTATYFTGVQYKNQAGTLTTLTPTSGGASIDHLLVNTTPVVQNATRSVTVNYTLPTTAGNAYNLATSTIVLTIHAVQADNNAVPVGCTLGAVCTTSMNWS